MSKGISFIYLKEKPEINTILNMFVSEWLSDVCHSGYEVKTGTILFEAPEDEVIVRLTGLPPTLTNYLSFDYECV